MGRKLSEKSLIGKWRECPCGLAHGLRPRRFSFFFSFFFWSGRCLFLLFFLFLSFFFFFFPGRCLFLLLIFFSFDFPSRLRPIRCSSSSLCFLFLFLLLSFVFCFFFFKTWFLFFNKFGWLLFFFLIRHHFLTRVYE